MDESTEMLATRRSRRSTAGNRMEAVMAEMAVEEENKDMEDDNDFVNDKIEEYIFGSDFESTDEEAEKEAQEAGETEVVNEERKVKKAARSRLEKITAAAHEKNKSTFNPDIQISTNTSAKPKPKPSTSLQVIIDAESGNVVAQHRKGIDGKKRTSQRKHTVLNTSATVTRLKQSAAKRASQPKKAKVESRNYTQGELIALALDTEEGNIVEHRDYLKNEAEKRKRARVIRTAVSGPLIRWISRKEEVKVVVPPPPPPPPSVVPQAPVPSIYRSIYGPPGSLFTPTTYSYSSGNAVVTTLASTSASDTQFKITTPATAAQKTPYSPFQHYLDTASSPFPTWPPTTTRQSYYPNVSQPSAQQQTPVTPSVQPQAANVTPSAPPEPQYRLETVAKNYVVHELAQQKGTPKPTWTDTMQSMFGDHVKWDQIKAHYLDPRSGVPYADSHAYKVLTGLLRHEYVWNAALGCYLDRGEPPPEVLEREKQMVESPTDDDMNIDDEH
ncbi:hypothetical protein M413DRAFT_29672 [Hebeloma cylindrosporum]|uniref:Uncharacterized protein n=1 Tax=Hebeloma cylindrosporum TaxID=76867 RepID=A0A0C2XN89_HEBCY|nr:hypothetical protein M413DRAFT_29672 [Hebeloma cylindrosporum h7]